jgi:hypothetical protein
MTPLIRVVSIIIVPIAFLIAVSHLLGAERGPGDGFTAGIIMALALTLQYETRGFHHLPVWMDHRANAAALGRKSLCARHLGIRPACVGPF